MSALGQVLADWKAYRHLPMRTSEPRPKKYRPRTQPAAPTAMSLRKIICDRHGVTCAELCGIAKSRKLVEARRELAHTLRVEKNWSISKIARFMGNRHHSTVINLLNPKQQRSPDTEVKA